MRIIDRFEERFLALVREQMTEDEFAETDHQVTPVLLPQQGPNGIQPALGFHLALARRLVTLNERLMMTDLCPDPYIAEAELKLKVEHIVNELRASVSINNAQRANGTAEIPPGGRLIIPGRG